jgi:hypothetical protein
MNFWRYFKGFGNLMSQISQLMMFSSKRVYKMSSNLQKQFIEAYLRDGADSQQFNMIKAELYRQGLSRLEVIELIIAANLFGSLENFYRKQL